MIQIPGLPPGARIVAAQPQVRPIELPLADGGRICFHPGDIKVIEEIREYWGTAEDPRPATRLCLATLNESWVVEVTYDRLIEATGVEPQRLEEKTDGGGGS